MKLFLISFVMTVFSMLAMAVGVICGRQSIRGSCGGLSDIEGLEAECAACSDCEKYKLESGFRGRNVDPISIRRCHANRNYC